MSSQQKTDEPDALIDTHYLTLLENTKIVSFCGVGEPFASKQKITSKRLSGSRITKNIPVLLNT